LRGAEATLLEDFLDFTDREFPRLHPFDRLALCGESKYRLHRRCRSILEEIAPDRVRYHKGWAWFIELGQHQPARMAALVPRVRKAHSSLELTFAPGDTMSQAKRLYKKLDRRRLEELIQSGWVVTTNFHMSFMAKNLVSTDVQMDVLEYVEYWGKHRGDLAQVQRDNFDAFFNKLVDDGLATLHDRTEFDRRFTNTERQTINVCPGLTISRRWSLDDARDLDDAGQLVPTVRSALMEALSAWGGSLPELTA